MWPTNFEKRLESWTQLRTLSSTAELESALLSINNWWFRSPWKPYYLHWDDQDYWPDPWQLLDDNFFCPVARGLGILYTIAIINRPDLQDAVLTEVEGDNLVLANKRKYILNWDQNTVLNTNPEVKIKRKITQQDVAKKYRLL